MTRAHYRLAYTLLLPYPRLPSVRASTASTCDADLPANGGNMQRTTKMLNTKPHTVTRGMDGDAVTLVFYPDTGCLRFSDVRGVCHELRPPHSWFAISSSSRGVCDGKHALTEGLSALLRDFCAKRPPWMSGPARLALSTPAHRPLHRPVRIATDLPADLPANSPIYAPSSRPLEHGMASVAVAG